MPHVITDECTKCGSCVEVCPFEAISEGEERFQIDPEVCTDCGLCAEECSSGAIVEQE